MTRLHWLILAVALLLPAALPADAAGLPVVKKTFAFSANDIDVSIEYPRTGNKAIDAALLAYVHRATGALKEFKDAMKSRQFYQGGFSLETTYEVERNDAKMFAIMFRESSMTGGPHPNDSTTTFNFLLPDGALVLLSEIVDGPRGMARISALAIADLIKTIESDGAVADSERIALRLEPRASNFDSFVWLSDGLHLYFGSDQVAPYVSGPQEATIALSALRDVMRSDWRAPVPSFDCKKAATAIEKSICASAALARLDRQVAEKYETNLRYASDAAATDALKQTQRRWIATRNKHCGSKAPGPCLARLYRDRLAVLNKTPW